jgi:uncharacterized protein
MQVIRQSDYKVMPWRNGGGTTTEIYASPGGDSGFDWRFSIATVAADGPFSLFKGFERHIMMLEGNGMKLDMAGIQSFKLQPLEPFSFSGDIQVHGSLVDGAVRDFNLMVRREFGTGKLQVHTCLEPHRLVSNRGQLLVHVLSRESYLLESGENMAFAAGDRLVICEINPHLRRAPAA